MNCPLQNQKDFAGVIVTSPPDPLSDAERGNRESQALAGEGGGRAGALISRLSFFCFFFYVQPGFKTAVKVGDGTYSLSVLSVWPAC